MDNQNTSELDRLNVLNLKVLILVLMDNQNTGDLTAYATLQDSLNPCSNG